MSFSPTSPTNTDARSFYKKYEKAGVLYKTRDVFSGRRPRLFVLDGLILHYYLQADDPAPRKSILLMGCAIELLPEERSSSGSGSGKSFFPFVISHAKSAKVYSLATTTSESREEWVKVLETASKQGEATLLGMDNSSSSSSSNVSNGNVNVEVDSSMDETDIASSSSSSSSNTINTNTIITNDPALINVPPQYHKKVTSSISTLVELVTSPLDTWQPLFSKKGVIARTRPGKLVTVRGDGLMPHHPKQVFNALVNIEKKKDYDNQLEEGRRVAKYNNHTFCDYLQFKPVWPTAVRDFCNILTWKVVEVEDRPAIVMAAFEAFEVPNKKSFVRGECVVAGWVIVPVLDAATNSIHSKVTCLVSTDLKGNLPSSIVNQVTSQQALFPVIISKFLMVSEPKVPDCLQGKTVDGITTKSIVVDIIDKLPRRDWTLAFDGEGVNATGSGSGDGGLEEKEIEQEKIEKEAEAVKEPTPPSLPTPTPTSPPKTRNTPTPTPTPSPTSTSGVIVPTSPALTLSPPSILFSFLALHLPVFLWALCKFSFLSPILDPLRGIFFALGLVVGLRFFAERRLGRSMTYADGSGVGLAGNGNGGTGAVTTTFVVDLKKVLRYIEGCRKTQRSKDKDKDKGGSDNLKSEVAVTHIALKAAAQVLGEMPAFNGRKVSLPLLGLSGYFPNATIDVSTALGKHSNGTSGFVKVSNADKLSIFQISRRITELVGLKRTLHAATSVAEKVLPDFLRGPLTTLSEQLDLPVGGLGLKGRRFGSALIYCSPNSGNSEVAVSVAPATFPSAASIIIVVGGVRVLQQYSKENRAAVARPVLEISVTIDVPVCNVNSCRRFTERLQQLIREPDMLDKY